MSDTLYIQTDENMEVHHPHVYLQDIVTFINSVTAQL